MYETGNTIFVLYTLSFFQKLLRSNVESLRFAEAEEDSGTLKVRSRTGSARVTWSGSETYNSGPHPREPEAVVWKPRFEQDP